MGNKYTNTIKAAAYSLSVDEEVLQQCLEQMREVSARLKDTKSPDLFVTANIKVAIEKKRQNDSAVS